MRGLPGIVAARSAAAIDPYARWWAGADRRERTIGAVAFLAVAALAGAFLFGAIHLVVGGVVKGNWRAGRFGIALSTITGLLLIAGHLRLSPRFRR